MKIKKLSNGKCVNLGFQTQVQKSSENAELVLKTVPDIENQIRNVDDVVHEAENVNFAYMNSTIFLEHFN